jgi:dienelactone hydrolase
MRTWESAGTFVLEAFGIVPHEGTLPAVASVVPVDYIGSIDNAALRGYLAMPDDSWDRPLSAVVVIPDWDGVNTYEKERATALAELGYVAMAADIYGADKQENIEIPERIELITKYSTDPTLFVARINDAIDQLKMVEGVDPAEIGLIGYCFGGSVSIRDMRGSCTGIIFGGS